MIVATRLPPSKPRRKSPTLRAVSLTSSANGVATQAPHRNVNSRYLAGSGSQRSTHNSAAVTTETGTTAANTPTTTAAAPACAVTRPNTNRPHNATATMPVTGNRTVTRRVTFLRACRTTVAGPLTPGRVVVVPAEPRVIYARTSRAATRSRGWPADAQGRPVETPNAPPGGPGARGRVVWLSPRRGDDVAGSRRPRRRRPAARSPNGRTSANRSARRPRGPGRGDDHRSTPGHRPAPATARPRGGSACRWTPATARRPRRRPRGACARPACEPGRAPRAAGSD